MLFERFAYYANFNTGCIESADACIALKIFKIREHLSESSSHVLLIYQAYVKSKIESIIICLYTFHRKIKICIPLAYTVTVVQSKSVLTANFSN